MGVQNSNFVSIFSQNRGFSSQILHFLDENLPRKKRFSSGSKFRGELPSATTPLAHGTALIS